MFPLVIASGMLAYSSVKWYKSRHLVKPVNTASLSNSMQDEMTWKGLKHENEVAASAMTLMLFGRTFFPLLTIPAILGFSYLTTPLLERAYQRWQQRRELDSKIILSIAMPALLLNGYYLSASFSFWFYSFTRKTQWFNQHVQQMGGRPSLSKLNFAQQVWVVKQNIELQVSVKLLRIGDVVRLNVGDIAPADGVVVRGNAVVNDLGLGTAPVAMVEKMLESEIFATSVLESGQLYIRVKRLPQHSFAARVQQLFTQSTAPVLLEHQKVFENQATSVDMDIALMRHLSLYFASLEHSFLVLTDYKYPNARTLVAKSTIKKLRVCLEQGIQFQQARCLTQLGMIDKWVIEPHLLNKNQAKLWLKQGIHLSVLYKGKSAKTQATIKGLPRCSLADYLLWKKQGQKLAFIGTDLALLRQSNLGLTHYAAGNSAKKQADILLNLHQLPSVQALLKLCIDLQQHYLSSARLKRLPGVAVYGGIYLVHVSTVAQTQLDYPEDRGWLLQLPMPLVIKTEKKDPLFEN